MATKNLLIRNFQSPGDIVMLTAAIRDLHKCYPKQFVTDVRTSCPALWENNPFLTPLNPANRDVTVIDGQYPLIHQSNFKPYHFIHGFIEDLNQKFGLAIKPTAFKGDIHISDLERSWMSQVEELTGLEMPFWVINAGGKRDFTTKWWDAPRFQKVVDAFRERILFVQIGEYGHYHPPLKGVINLIGRTDLRQLVRLIYHSDGVLTPVSLPMHLCAAADTKQPSAKNRACVVIAGGREPPHWEAYPHHQFIHTNGALLCCDNGGCWKSRVEPIGDGDEKDHPANLCVDTVGKLPRCMHMIRANDVVQRIELYYRGGSLSYLSAEQAQRAAEAVAKQNDALPHAV